MTLLLPFMGVLIMASCTKSHWRSIKRTLYIGNNCSKQKPAFQHMC